LIYINYLKYNLLHQADDFDNNKLAFM